MNHVIMIFPLQVLEVEPPDGLSHATVWIPIDSLVLHLGTVPGTEVIAVYALAEPPPKAPSGLELPYAPTKVKNLEFIVTAPGSRIPRGYKFRAPVRTKEGELIFLFEKETTGLLLVPRGQG